MKTTTPKTETPLLQWMGEDNDEDIFFLDFLAELTTLLKKANSEGFWYVEVKGFGWRGSDGKTYIQADNAQEFLGRILPQTDCHYKIFKGDKPKTFKIQNFHHDSPMGNEWYYIRPTTERMYYRWKESR